MVKAGVWASCSGWPVYQLGLHTHGQASLCREAPMFLQSLHGGFQFLPAVDCVCRQGLTQICKICEEQARSTRPMSLLESPVVRRGVWHACFGSHPRCSFNHFRLALSILYGRGTVRLEI